MLAEHERHVEAMRLLGEAEDLHNMGETMTMTMPGSVLGRLVLALGRLGLWIGHRLEHDCRVAARRTYDRHQRRTVYHIAE